MPLPPQPTHGFEHFLRFILTAPISKHLGSPSLLLTSEANQAAILDLNLR